MPGSFIPDPDNLVDCLIPIADDIREDIAVDFGVRAYRVFVTTRVYPDGVIDSGADPVTTEIELTPRPDVLAFHQLYKGKMEPCGFDDSGFIRLKKVSTSYIQLELGWGDQPDGTEIIYELREGESQQQLTTEWVLDRQPYPDRGRALLGWEIWLRRLGEAG